MIDFEDGNIICHHTFLLIKWASMKAHFGCFFLFSVVVKNCSNSTVATFYSGVYKPFFINRISIKFFFP